MASAHHKLDMRDAKEGNSMAAQKARDGAGPRLYKDRAARDRERSVRADEKDRK
jgi:hypothetical protein